MRGRTTTATTMMCTSRQKGGAASRSARSATARTRTAAQLRIMLFALGDYDARFGANTGPVTAPHPIGFQDVEVGVHLWGI